MLEIYEYFVLNIKKFIKVCLNICMIKLNKISPVDPQQEKEKKREFLFENELVEFQDSSSFIASN